jgi:hypothetical protein
MPEEITIDSYKFQNFALAGGTSVTFTVETLEGRDVTEQDVPIVKDMLIDLGKWECLRETGKHLLSDLGIRQQATLQNYEKPFGIELYEIEQVERNPYTDSLQCSIHIRIEERHKRESLNVNPIFTVEEITNQIGNIPRWKAFKKTMSIIKEQLR